MRAFLFLRRRRQPAGRHALGHREAAGLAGKRVAVIEGTTTGQAAIQGADVRRRTNHGSLERRELELESPVPLNLTASYLTRVGRQPLSLGAGLRYWAESPDTGPRG